MKTLGLNLKKFYKMAVNSLVLDSLWKRKNYENERKKFNIWKKWKQQDFGLYKKIKFILSSWKEIEDFLRAKKVKDHPKFSERCQMK